MTFFKLSVKDEEINKSPEVQKWLREAAECMAKTKVKVEYYFFEADKTRVEIIEDTIEGHYARCWIHVAEFGINSFKYLWDTNEK